MTTTQTASPLQQSMLRASQHMQRSEFAQAEAMLTPFLAGAANANALHLMGIIRIRQQRLEEAAAFLARAHEADPRQPKIALNLGKALEGLGRRDEAIAAFRTAVTLQADFVDAYGELARLLHAAGQLRAAEEAYRALLQLVPRHGPAKLSLGAVLTDTGRGEEAELPLRQGLAEFHEPRLQGALHANLALALRQQSKHDEALENYDKARSLDPSLSHIELQRADLLQEMKQYDEAVSSYRKLLAREPLNADTHQAYNDLLYRIGRTEEYLKSYDRAPQTPDLQLGKASFLMHERRGQEAHEIYHALAVRDPGDPNAASGIAASLMLMQRHDEAAAAFDAMLAHMPGNPQLYSSAAAANLQAGDPQKAVALCEKGLALAPYDQVCLAFLGTGLRMMDDARDESLNGYDTLIQIFDLEPPEGFSDMESFNAELCTYLDRLHPDTREYINQSLRGGTQTPSNLFGARHGLVDRLQVRISETVGRYIAGLKPDERHAFLSRRKKDFAYAGSWSSRLRDCGFHVNHFHSKGWISSCYYAGVPEAVKDTQARQGWIKFGEPALEGVTLKDPIRRAIQPVPGRLVLFPSYMWHGTVPFQGPTPRTTIAFDVVPT